MDVQNEARGKSDGIFPTKMTVTNVQKDKKRVHVRVRVSDVSS